MKFVVLSLAAVAALAVSVGTASAQSGVYAPYGGTVVVGTVPVVPNFSGYLYPTYRYGTYGYSGYGSGVGLVPARPTLNLVVGAGGAYPAYNYGYSRSYYGGYYGGYHRGYYGRRW